jgi:hypothetical protein
VPFSVNNEVAIVDVAVAVEVARQTCADYGDDTRGVELRGVPRQAWDKRRQLECLERAGNSIGIQYIERLPRTWREAATGRNIQGTIEEGLMVRGHMCVRLA